MADNSVMQERLRTSQAAQKPKISTFKGFEGDRYQEHDAAILAAVTKFNEDKGAYVGATTEQAAGISDLDPALVKAWMI